MVASSVLAVSLVASSVWAVSLVASSVWAKASSLSAKMKPSSLKSSLCLKSKFFVQRVESKVVYMWLVMITLMFLISFNALKSGVSNISEKAALLK